MGNLLEKLRPALQGARTVEWPGPVPEGMKRPRITLHALNGLACEDAHLAALAHFKRPRGGAAASPADPIFIVREQAEQLWRAARDEEGQPIAKDTNELQELLTPQMRDQLWAEWLGVQNEFAVGPHSELEVRDLVEGLKKKFPEDLLRGWPSSWLLRLLRSSVDQLSRLEATSSSGFSPSGRDRASSRLPTSTSGEE